MTAANVVAAGKLATNHLVDHICLSEGLAANVSVSCWEPVDSERYPMSDHPWVEADIG